MAWNIVLYQTENGNCPVAQFLETLSPKKIYNKCQHKIDLLSEFGNCLREPHTKPIQAVKGLFELRIEASSKQYRILYFFDTKKQSFVLLHAFIKKGNMRSKDSNIARERMKDYLSGAVICQVKNES